MPYNLHLENSASQPKGWRTSLIFKVQISLIFAFGK